MERKGEFPGGEGRTAGTLAAASMRDSMAGYAEATRTMLWAIEGTRVMLEFNRTLLDLGRDVLRRQQDAAIETTLRAFRGSTEPDRAPAEAGFPDLARLSVEAFDRMVAAMRAANDAALRAAAARSAEAERRTAAP